MFIQVSKVEENGLISEPFFINTDYILQIRKKGDYVELLCNSCTFVVNSDIKTFVHRLRKANLVV